MKKVFGYKPNKWDRRDLNYQYNSKRRKARNQSRGKQAIDYLPFIYDQKSIGSCVANAFVLQLLIELIRMGKFGSKNYLSRLYSYYFARLIDGDQHEDEGTRIASAYKAAKKYGITDEDKWKYNIKKVNKKPSFYASLFAYAKKDIFNYYWIGLKKGENKSEAVKHANENGKAVIGGTPIFKDFREFGSGSTPLKPHNMSKSIGNHAITFVKTIEKKSHNEHVVANSWGVNYGDNGLCVFHEDYVNWSGLRDLGCVFLKKDFLK